MRKQGHKLNGLLEIADEIVDRRGLTVEDIRLPRTSIHEGIISVLSDFANNITQYYNLDLITGDPRTARTDEPIRTWYDLVVTPTLNEHYDSRHQKQHQQNAEIVDALLGTHSFVLHHSERGDELNTLHEASLQTGTTEFVRPYVRMYVLQLARFLGLLLSELGYASYSTRLEIIPHFGDIFAIFNNPDSYFKSRKIWSIYKR